jgi:hypothetical protein
MVESRWNSKAQHYEAEIRRDVFSNALQNSPLYEGDTVAFQAAKRDWISRWMVAFGDVSEVWIEIPDARINWTINPTGHAVLCWSTFYPDFNGVFCFIPFQGASNEAAPRAMILWLTSNVGSHPLNGNPSPSGGTRWYASAVSHIERMATAGES